MSRHTILGKEYLLSLFPEDKLDKFYVLDCTYGQGLHSKLLLENYSNINIFAIDYDVNNKSYLPVNKNIKFVHQNFINAYKFIKEKNILIDYILLDLGTHMDQILNKDYGLSFMHFDADLNMKINNCDNNIFTADFVLNTYSFKKLSDMFLYYGNIKKSDKIALQIIEYRKTHKISKVSDIYNALQLSDKTNKQYLAKIFQAIRMEVNKEIFNLSAFLYQLENFFISENQKIKLITFTFHSLEDKIIKNFIKNKQITCDLEDMFNSLNIINFSKLRNTKKVCCSESTKKIYIGEKLRRKDLFFVIRSTTITQHKENMVKIN